MLRPSRPMIRPFISSRGRWTTVTVCSAVWSAATRCIAVRMMSRALSWASSRAARSMARASLTASCSASSRTASRSIALASSADMPVTRSSATTCSWCARELLALACRARARGRELAVLLLEHVGALVELLVALEEAALEGGQLAASGAGLVLGLAAEPELLVLGLEDQLLLAGASVGSMRRARPGRPSSPGMPTCCGRTCRGRRRRRRPRGPPPRRPVSPSSVLPSGPGCAAGRVTCAGLGRECERTSDP